MSKNCVLFSLRVHVTFTFLFKCGWLIKQVSGQCILVLFCIWFSVYLSGPFIIAVQCLRAIECFEMLKNKTSD